MPSNEELAATGLTRADYVETAEVWPENWPVVCLFLQLDTQWNTGLNGPTGLNYQTLFALLDRQGLDETEWQQWFEDCRLMEKAALKAMRND